MSGLVFVNNVVLHNTYGVKGSGTVTGMGTLSYYFPGFVFTGNQLVGGAAFSAQYPSGNAFPAAMPAKPPGP
jgi:hypothetical protein